MDTDAPSDETPSRAFALAAVEKSRVPDEWHRQGSAVLELNSELVVGYFDVDSTGTSKLTR